MNTLTVTRSEYNRWLNVLYNQEKPLPMITFVVQAFPLRINTEPSFVPTNMINNLIHYSWMGRGYRCSHKLIILDNVPCPTLPGSMQYSIREGYKTIPQLTQELTQSQPTSWDVVQAALAELHNRRPSN